MTNAADITPLIDLPLRTDLAAGIGRQLGAQVMSVPQLAEAPGIAQRRLKRIPQVPTQ